MKLTTRVLVPAVLCFSLGSAFADPPKRLIETSPGVRFWATPEEIAEISRKAHAAGKCGGYMDVTDFAIAKDARPTKKLRLDGREPKEQAKVVPLLKHANGANLIALVTKLSAFADRKLNTAEGEKAAKWIRDEYAKIAGERAGVSVQAVAHSRFRQPSVIATIQGAGPNKDEIVVVGGHLDSTSWMASAPGADDNASGTATVMEAFRILVESGFRPNRTIQFMGYAGEEAGLLGSQDIATRYRNEGKAVVAALQFDMTMFPGSTPRIAFVTDYVNADLTKFVQRLSDEYVKASWTETKCGYACSDHASWTRAGYPSAFPFETVFGEYNPDIHTPKDLVGKLDGSHGEHYLKLAVAFAIELAESAPNRTEKTELALR